MDTKDYESALRNVDPGLMKALQPFLSRVSDGLEARKDLGDLAVAIFHLLKLLGPHDAQQVAAEHRELAALPDILDCKGQDQPTTKENPAPVQQAREGY